MSKVREEPKLQVPDKAYMTDDPLPETIHLNKQTQTTLNKNKLPKPSTFAGDVMKLAGGTTIAQGLLVLASPLLARLYSPKDFGVLALFMSITSILGVIACLRYELAIMLPESDEDAVSLLCLSLFILLIMCIVYYLILLIFIDNIISIFRIKSLSIWLYYIPVLIFFTHLVQTINFWNNRKKKYYWISASRILLSVITVFLYVVMGLQNKGIDGLVTGNFAAQTIVAFVLLFQLLLFDKIFHENIGFKRILMNAKKYKDFPKFNTFHALVDMVQNNGVLLLISFFFSNKVLGYYSFSLRILQTPTSIIGGSISQVFYQKISQSFYEGKDLYKLTKRFCVRLMLLFGPIFLVICIASPFLFTKIFGDNWYESGIYTCILAPYMFMKLITSSLSTLLNVLNKLKEFFYITIFGNLIMLLSIIIGVYFSEIKIGLLVLTLFMSVYFLIAIKWMFNLTRLNNI